MEEEVKKTVLKNNDELNKYMDELNDDVKLTITNVREKSLTVSTIRAKWLGYLFKERENLSRINEYRTDLLKKKTETSSVSALRLKSEDAISASDEKIVKLNALKKITESNLDFIERALSILNDFSWQIRNLVEVLKLEGMS